MPTQRHVSPTGSLFRRIPVSAATQCLLIALFLALSFPIAVGAAPTNLFVAADGSGQFTNVQDAIMAVPAGSPDSPVLIHIKPGTYRELIYIQHEERYFRLLGEDPEKTVLTFNLNARMPGPDRKPMGTFRTASTVVDADDFTAENVTFENSAGPVGQALAIRIEGDRVVFRHCRFLGWQDTILDNRGRHYYTRCTIAGHVDFIFGAGVSFFDHCRIRCLGDGYLTAASTPPDHAFGFVFSHCVITGDEPESRTYLGRPWRNDASVAFLNSEMSDVVRPEGWNNWRRPEAEKTARYVEFGNTGPGADPKKRVAWARQLTARQAEAITVQSVLGGMDGWDPTGDPPLPAKAQPPARSDDEMKTDIEYGRVRGESLLLDADIPAGTGPFPIVLLVHGGGWSGGDKKLDFGALLQPLTHAGFTCFSINYRLAPANPWPACFEDVETAVRWAKRHAPEYKGDPACAEVCRGA